jgi:hypothetical protein
MLHVTLSLVTCCRLQVVLNELKQIHPLTTSS